MFCVRNTLGYNRTCYAKLSINSLSTIRRLKIKVKRGSTVELNNNNGETNVKHT